MRSILLFVHDLYEDLELWYPKIRLEEAGFKTTVAGPAKDTSHSGLHGYPCKADISFDSVDANLFDGLVIPGGYSPDKLRRIPKVLEIVREMNGKGKLIAYICHAGWVPISAKILKGKKTTGVSAIKDDLENAGALFEDAPVIVDGHLVSSRTPKDLPVFLKAILDVLK